MDIQASSLLVGFAAFSVGGLIGFLFGVPTLRPDEPSTNTTLNGRRPRTNLELVADWLTKALVGAGLVELKQIAPRVVDYARVGGRAFGDPFGTLMLLSVGCAFFACGVLTGYLWSQFHFQG